MRIAIIPARKGSKRIENKNIIDFFGRPIISYTIETCLKSGLFEKVYVSTDCAKIKDIALSFGASVDFFRPPELADDTTPVLAVARQVLRKFQDMGEIYDSFCMMMPCSPLVFSQDLIGAYRIFDAQTEIRYPVLSVCRYPSHPAWALGLSGDGTELMTPLDHGSLTKRSQDLPVCFYDTGHFSIQDSDVVLGGAMSVPSSFLKYEIDFLRAIDIDEMKDLDALKSVFSLYRKK